MNKYLDQNTRIRKRWFYLPALGAVYALQRRVWWGWKTTAWNYPRVLGTDEEVIVSWLLWCEKIESNWPPKKFKDLPF